MGERIDWLDTARAIGIVAVVVGHVTSNPALRAAMYHFHMPLFFMLSGLVFTPAPVRQMARRRGWSLLAPYGAWLVIVAVSDFVLATIIGYEPSLPWDRPVAALARALLGGTFLVGAFGVFWFATCLYLAQLAGAAILRGTDRQVALAAMLLVIAAHLVPHWPSPWGLISVPIALFFFLAGGLYRRHAPEPRPFATLAAGCAASLALIVRPLDLKIAEIGTPGLSVIAALGLCYLIIIVARRLPAIRWVSVTGRASVVIMYLHLTIFYALRGRLSEGVIAILATGLPVLLWLLLRRFPMTRALLLGERDTHTSLPTASAGTVRAPFHYEQP